MISESQRTITSKVSCNGVGLHTGIDVNLTLLPGEPDSGIIFRRSDLDAKESDIKAHYTNVVATNLGTVIANESGAKVSTIEHLMAAIWGCGIDNLIVEVSGPEVPVMDGSSEPFVFLIECAGIKTQDKARKVIEITKEIKIEGEDNKSISVSPAQEFGIDLHIDFDHECISEQTIDYSTTFASFKNDLARARTFGFKHEIEQLHKMGLAKGGSLDNAILIDENGVVNEEGLRYNNEFVKHKTLDFIGDIYLAGHFIIGHFKASKPGHGINNKMLHTLLSDNKDAWKIV